MTCDPCAELAQLKDWLAKLLEINGLPLANALKLETSGYLLLEDGSHILLEN
jgi:hypothetical protein